MSNEQGKCKMNNNDMDYKLKSLLDLYQTMK